MALPVPWRAGARAGGSSAPCRADLGFSNPAEVREQLQAELTPPTWGRMGWVVTAEFQQLGLCFPEIPPISALTLAALFAETFLVLYQMSHFNVLGDSSSPSPLSPACPLAVGMEKTSLRLLGFGASSCTWNLPKMMQNLTKPGCGEEPGLSQQGEERRGKVWDAPGVALGGFQP